MHSALDSRTLVACDKLKVICSKRSMIRAGARSLFGSSGHNYEGFGGASETGGGGCVPTIDFLFDVNNHFRCAPSVCASFVRLFQLFTASCLLSVTMADLSIYSIR